MLQGDRGLPGDRGLKGDTGAPGKQGDMVSSSQIQSCFIASL